LTIGFTKNNRFIPTGVWITQNGKKIFVRNQIPTTPYQEKWSDNISLSRRFTTNPTTKADLAEAIRITNRKNVNVFNNEQKAENISGAFRNNRFASGMTREKMIAQVMASKNVMKTRGVPSNVIDEEVARNIREIDDELRMLKNDGELIAGVVVH